jgi:putative methyltransferase (TIGR04325 family)
MTESLPTKMGEPADEGRAAAEFSVWEGVYGSFVEAPAVGPGFHGPTWRNRSIEAAREAIARLKTEEALDYALRQRNSILPTTVATMLTAQERVSVLDFGGGLGTGYVFLTQTMPNAISRVDYAIVDVEEIATAGRELFNDAIRPIFYDVLPDGVRYDIVHSASAIQYVDGWPSLIRRLTNYGAQYFSLADAFIGEFNTYATLQNYYGSKIPHWFFNACDLIGEVERNGYKLALRTSCDAKILGRYGPLPMQNFPPALRLLQTSNLLFRRGTRP